MSQKPQDKPAVPPTTTTRPPATLSGEGGGRGENFGRVTPASDKPTPALSPKVGGEAEARKPANPLPAIPHPAPSIPPVPPSAVATYAQLREKAVGDGGRLFTVKLGVEPEQAVLADDPEAALQEYMRHFGIRSFPSEMRPLIFEVSEGEDDKLDLHHSQR